MTVGTGGKSCDGRQGGKSCDGRKGTPKPRSGWQGGKPCDGRQGGKPCDGRQGRETLKRLTDTEKYFTDSM